MSELELIPEDNTPPTYTLLRMAAGGLIIASSVVAPNILQLLAKQLGTDKNQKSLRAIRYAKERGWLTFEDTPNGVRVALTAKGSLKWQRVELNRPLKDDRWDRRWRLVMFDVPNRHKAGVEAFRGGLKRLGLKQLQRSVWVTPYTCQTQVAILRQMYGLKKYVRILESDKIEDEDSLKTQFDLNL